MKRKYLLLLSIVALVASCYKKPDQPKEEPVTKTVQYRIAQGKDYSSPTYDGLKVELKLSVAKESTIDGKVLAAWDTAFELISIRNYAPTVNPLTITKQFNDVWQSNQVLRVSHVIKYVTATNQVSQTAFGETIPVFVSEKQVTINL